jgi:hypothetical protein
MWARPAFISSCPVRLEEVMKFLTAVAAASILNVSGAAAVTAQYYPEPSRRYGHTDDWWRAERIVREAYLDVLGREPDRAGLRQYADAIVNRDWSEADVRRSLRASSEYRDRAGSSRGSLLDARAASIVRRAYRDVLGREPDAEGMREYTTRILRDGWTENDVRRALRASAEYRR